MGKGFGNPTGTRVRVQRVRVRVRTREPLKNPYPCQGSGVTLGMCHGFFVSYNLHIMSLVSYSNYEMLILKKTVLHSSISSTIVELRAWERSLKPRSTVDLGFILSSSHHHPRRHHLNLRSRNSSTWCPSPLTRDVSPLMERKEEPERGPKKWEAKAVRFFPLVSQPH